MNKFDTERVKEDFCPGCVAIPMAFMGAGVAGLGAQKKGQYRKSRKWMMWIGIILVIISTLIGIWYFSKCKECE